MTNREKAAREIANFCHLLKRTARSADLSHLTYLLEITALEASLIEASEFNKRNQQQSSAA